jgi:hypothetical protein
MATARATVFKSGRYSNTVSASADTVVNAVSLLQAKLAVTVGTITSVSTTEEMDALSDLALINNPLILGAPKNATLTLQGAVNANGKRRKINLEVMDMADSLARPTSLKGEVDNTNTSLVAIATTFCDNDGNYGYLLHSGKYQSNFSKRGKGGKR